MSPSASQPSLQNVKHWGPELSLALLAVPWKFIVPQSTDAFLIKLLAHPPSLGLAILVFSPAHAALLFESLSAPTLFRRLGASSGASQQSLGEQDEKARWQMVVGALAKALESQNSKGLDVSGDISRWEASLSISYPCSGLPGRQAHLKLSLEALSPGESADAFGSHLISPLMGCMTALTKGAARSGDDVEEMIESEGEKVHGSDDVSLACLRAFFAPRTDGKGGRLADGAGLLSSFSQAAFGLSPVLAPSPTAEDDEDLVLTSPQMAKKEPSRTPSISASPSPEAGLSRFPKPTSNFGRFRSPSPRPSPSPGLRRTQGKRFGGSPSDSSSDDDMVIAASGRPAAARESAERSSGCPTVPSSGERGSEEDGEVLMAGGGGKQVARRGSEEEAAQARPVSPSMEASRSQGSGTESEDEPILLPSTQPRTGGTDTQDSTSAGDGLNMFSSSTAMLPDDQLDDPFSGTASSRQTGTDADLSATLDEEDVRGVASKSKAPPAEEWKPAREVVRTQTEAATLAALVAKRARASSEGEEDGGNKEEAGIGSGGGAPPAPKRGGGAYKRGMARRGRF